MKRKLFIIVTFSLLLVSCSATLHWAHDEVPLVTGTKHRNSLRNSYSLWTYLRDVYWDARVSACTYLNPRMTITYTATHELIDCEPYGFHITYVHRFSHNRGTFSTCEIAEELRWSGFMNSDIQSVILPEGVKTTGYGLFGNCQQLVEVALPSSLEEISTHTFFNCKSLQEISIPQNVEIWYAAFARCTSLKDVQIGDGCTFFSSNVFEDCTSLEHFDCPVSAKKIHESTFEGCTSLREVHLSDSLSLLGKRAFMDCTSLETLSLPASLEELGDSVFVGCTSLQSISLSPSGNPAIEAKLRSEYPNVAIKYVE